MTAPRFPHLLSSAGRLALCLTAIAVWLAAGPAAHAQIQVDLKLSRRSYILYEPLIATVTVTNNAGHDVTFEDISGKQWFNVEVSTGEESIVPPYDTDYKLHPLTVLAGQTLQRQIDLTPLFPIRDMGMHRLRATVYLAEFDRYFYSNYATFDMTDGKLIWRQSVGLPGESGSVRQVTLLTHSLPEKMMLYARVRDENGPNVYTTQSLGRLVIGGKEPEAMFDRQNTLHVLHEAQPGTYLHTVVNLNGGRDAQQAFRRSGPSRPSLRKDSSGNVEVRGGILQEAAALATGGPKNPKISDRPVGLPGTPNSKAPDGF